MNNQSDLHNKLSQKTFNWLASRVTQRGMKWLQEFTLLNGLRPDAVAFCDLMQGQYEKFVVNIADLHKYKEECVKLRHEYLYRIFEKSKDGKNLQPVRNEWAEAYRELIKKYNLVENRFMFAFETKVNKSDFDNTFKYERHKPSKKQPFANFHFLVMPKKFDDYVQLDLLPEWYGILEQAGSGLSIRKMPVYKTVGEIDFYMNAYNMLFRWSEEKQNIQQLNGKNFQKAIKF